MANTGTAKGRYRVIPTTPTGTAKGRYYVIGVKISDLATSGTVRLHQNLSSRGVVPSYGRAKGRYQVTPRPRVTVVLAPIQDAFVWTYRPKISYGDLEDIVVGLHSGYLARGLVQFDLSGLRQDLLILSATLRLRARFTGTGVVGVYPALQPWREQDVTWDNQPTASPTPVATAEVPHSVGDAVEFNVLDLFLGWYQGTQANRGVSLRVTDETAGQATLFGSREAGPAWQPELVITHYLPDPLGGHSYLDSAGTVRAPATDDLPSAGEVVATGQTAADSRLPTAGTVQQHANLPSGGYVVAQGNTYGYSDRSSRGKVQQVSSLLTAGDVVLPRGGPQADYFPTAGRVRGPGASELVSTGAVAGAPVADPCTQLEQGTLVTVAYGPYTALLESPYASPDLPDLPHAVAQGLVQWAWAPDRGYGVEGWLLLDVLPGGLYYEERTLPVTMRVGQYQWEWQGFRVWLGDSPNQPLSDSPYWGDPAYLTTYQWYRASGDTLGRLVPTTWYVHARVYEVPSGPLPCRFPSSGAVSRRYIPSSGTVQIYSSLPTSGQIRGGDHDDFTTLAQVSRRVTPTAGTVRVRQWSDLPSVATVRAPGTSSLPSSGQAAIGPNSLPTTGSVQWHTDLPTAGKPAHTPDELPTAGLVPWRDDLPTAGKPAHTPDELPTAGTVRVVARDDLPSQAHASSPWMASTGRVQNFSDLFSQGGVRIHSSMLSAGFVAYGGVSDLPGSGVVRVRDASDLLTTAGAVSYYSTLPTRGIVTAIVLEIDIDLRAWPPEGRSSFPQG